MSNLEVSFNEFRKFLNDPNCLVIDVREPNELEEDGRINGTINVPLGILKDTLQKATPEDFRKSYGRNKPKSNDFIIFSCRSGRRSLTAIDTAKKLGFTNVKHFPGGYLGWQKQQQQQQHH